MTEEIARFVARVAPQDEPVFTVEPGGVWLSGMNANLRLLHYRVVGGLQKEGYHVGKTRDEAGGYFIEVPDCERYDTVELLEEVAFDAE